MTLNTWILRGLMGDSLRIGRLMGRVAISPVSTLERRSPKTNSKPENKKNAKLPKRPNEND
jgi:hypothetical protein